MASFGSTTSYQEYVAGLAKDGLEAERDQGSDIETWITETADSEACYVADCLEILNYSPNDGAFFEDFGSLEATGFTDAVTKMAVAAMARDLHEAIDDARPEFEAAADSDDDSDGAESEAS